MTAAPFRDDIRLLRAMAVCAVVGYHFDLPGLRGGFAGVDCFFAVSGYLMTRILCGGGEAGPPPGYGAFLAARARRIVPALLVMCALALPVGYALLGSEDFRALGRHVQSALVFVSNFTFKDEDGYFDAPSQTKWMLHTWSLSVEWQFYMVYPFLLRGLRRVAGGGGKRTPAMLLACAAALSFVGACARAPYDPAAVFFMLPARAWELLAGGAVALTPCGAGVGTRRVLNALGWAGLAFSFVFCSDTSLWPGPWTALPVVAAAAVLWTERTPPAFFRRSVWMLTGDLSYSLYLWHWPVKAGMTYAGVSSFFAAAVGVPLSAALAALSYLWVEKPGRAVLRDRRALGALTVAVLAVLGGAQVPAATRGLPSRLPESVLAAERGAADRLTPAMLRCYEPPYPGFPLFNAPAPCVAGGAPGLAPSVYLWGDSHAESVARAVAEATPGGALVDVRQCPSLPDTELRSNSGKVNCTRINREVLARIHALPKNVALVVLNRYSVHLKGPNEGGSKPWGFVFTDTDLQPEGETERYEAYAERFASVMCAVARERRLVIIGPVPEPGRDVPRELIRARMTGRPDPDLSISRAEYAARHDAALEAIRRARACGAVFVDPTEALCDAERCGAVRNGVPLYFDDDHLNLTGAALLKPLLAKALSESGAETP